MFKLKPTKFWFLAHCAECATPASQPATQHHTGRKFQMRFDLLIGVDQSAAGNVVRTERARNQQPLVINNIVPISVVCRSSYWLRTKTANVHCALWCRAECSSAYESPCSATTPPSWTPSCSWSDSCRWLLQTAIIGRKEGSRRFLLRCGSSGRGYGRMRLARGTYLPTYLELATNACEKRTRRNAAQCNSMVW